MNPKNLASPKPLTPTDNNRRKSSRVKPLNKVKENNAQQEEGIIVHKNKIILVINAKNTINILEEGQREELTLLMLNK